MCTRQGGLRRPRRSKMNSQRSALIVAIARRQPNGAEVWLRASASDNGWAHIPATRSVGRASTRPFA
eukprot:6174153-Pleurochrysis_carterae.AAC.1